MKTKLSKKLFIVVNDIGCCAYDTEKELIDNVDVEQGDKVAVYKLVEVKTFITGLK